MGGRGGGGAEGIKVPQRFYERGSAPAEILLNLVAVIILASPETLDVEKKTTFIHSKFVFIYCIHRQLFGK